MNKSFIITFSVSTIIFATGVVVTLMLLLPKQLISLKTSVESYQNVERANFTYTKTKNISKEALLKEYKVTSDDISSFKNTHKYVAGKSDPFYRDDGSSSEDGNSNSTSGNTSGTTSGSSDAHDKTTNSNGGIENPPSTSK